MHLNCRAGEEGVGDLEAAADTACCCARGDGRVAEKATATARTTRTTRADDDDLATPTICWQLLLVLMVITTR